MPAERTLRNSITDVSGVEVAHLTVAEGDVQTGVTVVMPCPPSVWHRKFSLGAYAAGGGLSWTGVEVAEDFGTFASPIVLCNATSVGAAYDALITRGHKRDPELPVDDGWPPIVVGIDDGYLNDLRRRRVKHDDVLAACEAARGEPPACGSVGVGRGLVALGFKGGVGDAAAAARVGSDAFVVGVLLAANGGAPRGTSAVRVVSPGFVAIVATDAPLFPAELRLLGEAAIRGIDAAVTIGGEEGRLALAFSVANTIDGSLTAPPGRLYEARRLGDDGLGPLFDAAARASRAALGKALGEATAVTGRKGRTVEKAHAEIVASLAFAGR
ncbi:P1 family peptidase [Polyangium mundeleinium]|uniref:P1 family peptidase n=1 Tax=Polyangium mundeleinium TaxID=2995306 RepID=A0ABT5EHN0_9BACT|nr:P1 family peptidase [Polyangium mundeleinium]MDC0740427.1 P1 family peptidase [Polyangium mundeleinium]